MTDTDEYEEAKKIVEDAGLIDDNDDWDDWLEDKYRKIADLQAEVKRLQSIIDVFDEYMMNDFMTDYSRSEAHGIWNELVRGDGL